METVRFLIVGGGIAGLATARALGRLGAGPVLLLERGELGREASAQNAAILRTFGLDPVLRTLARRSAAFLREPPAGVADGPLVDPVGLVLLGRGETARLWRRAVHTDPDCGAREVPAAQRAALLPHVTPSTNELALYFPDDGRIAIHELIAGLARDVRAHGVELATGTAVEELTLADGRVTGARLASGDLVRADTVVLAAGGWAGRLGAAARSQVRLWPTRRHLGVGPPDPAVEPRWPVVWSDDAGFYHRPEAGGLLVCACDEEDVDPDALAVDAAAGAALLEGARTNLAGVEVPRLARLWCGVRTLTEDGRFHVGRDPGVDGLAWVAGLGGHGMTCGVETGRLAAAWLTGSDEDPELRRALAPGRQAPVLERG